MEEKANNSLCSIPCDQCGKGDFQPLFEKASEKGEIFSVVRCLHCGLVQVNPQPGPDLVAKYYESSYFERRTDRGYDNYFSETLKAQLARVYEMNLRDLAFFEFEESFFGRRAGQFSEERDKAAWKPVLQKKSGAEVESEKSPPLLQDRHGDSKPRSLDVGCAAGYFVEYMQNRGWQASGVELSKRAASFGKENLGLDIVIGDFLETKLLPENSYDFLSFWASIEHMHSPRRVLERCHTLLHPGGRLILSTCRWGALSAFRGKNWRFMNVPEHLYFFSLYGLLELCRELGFSEVAHVSYGSGFTTKKDAGFFYKSAKAILDPLVKILDQGDMMALHLKKI